MLLKFINNFFRCLLHCWSIMLILLFILLIGAIVISKSEGIDFYNSIYFAFITGLTVGYGDITPVTFIGKLFSILIAIVGMIFLGLLIAISSRALNTSMKNENNKNH